MHTGENIKKLRESRNLSRKEVAEVINRGEAFLKDVEEKAVEPLDLI